jgi:hypothetical protein
MIHESIIITHAIGNSTSVISRLVARKSLASTCECRARSDSIARDPASLVASLEMEYH